MKTKSIILTFLFLFGLIVGCQSAPRKSKEEPEKTETSISSTTLVCSACGVPIPHGKKSDLKDTYIIENHGLYIEDADSDGFIQGKTKNLDKVIMCQFCGYAALPENYDKVIFPPIADEISKELNVKTRDLIVNLYLKNQKEEPKQEEIKKKSRRRKNKDDEEEKPKKEKIVVDPDLIPLDTKFHNANITAGINGDTRRSRGELTRQAIWALRSEFCDFTNYKPLRKSAGSFARKLNMNESDLYKNPLTFSMVLEQVISSKTKQIVNDETREEFVMYMVLMGIFYNRMGETGPAAASLSQAIAFSKNQENKDEIRKRLDYLKNELFFATETVKNMKMALLRHEYSKKEIPEILYLIADYHRRAGHLGYSKKWYLIAKEFSKENKEIQEKANKQIKSSFLQNHDPAPLTDYDKNLVGDIFVSLNKNKLENEWTIAQQSEVACYNTMKKCFAAIEKYRHKHGKYPQNLTALKQSEFGQEEGANNFICPFTKKSYIYVPPENAKDTLVKDLFPHDIKGMKTRCLLHQDGRVSIESAK